MLIKVGWISVTASENATLRAECLRMKDISTPCSHSNLSKLVQSGAGFHPKWNSAWKAGMCNVGVRAQDC